MKVYKPKKIIVCNEYSFTSSVLSKYCSEAGIEHINIMHGEKLFYIRDSFFRFDKCYVWDEYYKQLFLKLRAEKNQFIIEIPKSLIFANNNSHQQTIVDYTYYLGGERGKVLKLITDCIDKIRNKGYVTSIRPHPRYTDINELKSLIDDALIEDFKLVTIEESLLRTCNAISLYSTVLNQAYHNNTKVIIDDISQPEKFEKLRDLQYIMLAKDHKLLSEVMERI